MKFGLTSALFLTCFSVAFPPQTVAIELGEDSAFERQGFTVGGIQIGVQPRIEGGAMYYDYEQDQVAIPNASQQEVRSLAAMFPEDVLLASGASKFEVSAVLPTLSGGITVFADRFFLDLSALRAFPEDDKANQSTQDAVSFSSPGFGVSLFLDQQLGFDVDVDREEYQTAVGYSITDQFAVFAGYRYSDTDFETAVNGSFTFDSVFQTGDPSEDPFFTDRLTGTLQGNSDLKLIQQGPFFGATYGLPMSIWVFDGALSFRLALAVLDGQVIQKNGPFTTTFADGSQGVDPASKSSFEGDAVGLALGLTWRGTTPVTGLGYAISVSGHQYDFDADSSGRGIVGEPPDFKETAISGNVGLTYSF